MDEFPRDQLQVGDLVQHINFGSPLEIYIVVEKLDSDGYGIKVKPFMALEPYQLYVLSHTPFRKVPLFEALEQKNLDDFPLWTRSMIQWRGPIVKFEDFQISLP